MKKGEKTRKSEGLGECLPCFELKDKWAPKFTWKSEMQINTQKAAILRQKITDSNR